MFSMYKSPQIFLKTEILHRIFCDESMIKLEINNKKRAWHDGLAAKVLALNSPGSHMCTGSNPGSPTSHPAPCLWPEKAVEDGPRSWEPTPASETWKKLLAFDWLSFGKGGYFGSEPVVFPSLCKSDFQ